MAEALEVPSCRVTAADDVEGGLVLSVERRRRGGCCPGCGRPSRAGHGRYRRRPADLPSLGRPVRLDLEVRRLRCANAACPHRTFTERVPSLVMILPQLGGSPALCVEGPWGRDSGTLVQGVMTLLCSLPGCDVDRVVRDLDRLVIVAHRRCGHGRCPSCGVLSSAVHSRYDRRPDDLPSLGQAVRLCIQVRRFYCRHPDCRRRTFAEGLPRLLAPRARRTRRLAQAQARIGLALGGEAGARLVPHLAMATSPDTVLRLVRRMPLPKMKEPRAIGIDDWAWRKGRSGGTLVVDLERQRPLDLLPDRSGPTLAAWLRRHPRVAIVARDRSTAVTPGP